MKKIPWRALAAASIVAAGFCFVVAVYFVGLTDKNAADRDYIGYWAAGQQLAHGANPYDSAATLQLERAVGYMGDRPRLTPSPPVALLMVLPLGYFSAKNGLILWLVLQIACLSISIWILWLLHGRPPTRLHLFGYLFAPVIACLMAGQLGIFFLLGIVLFLYLHKSWPMFAGAALVPCVLKPHLFMPFAIALIIWIVFQKAFRILAGFVVFLAANSAVAPCFDRRVWSHYTQMISNSEIQGRFTPTLSLSFRFLIDRYALWLQYVPLAVGCLWAVWYFYSRRNRFDWMDQGLLLLLVSVLCAPYSWFTDESVVLPAVLAALYRAVESKRSVLPIAAFAATALIELFAGLGITDRYFLWTAPAWLAWYLYATWDKSAHATDISRNGMTPS